MTLPPRDSARAARAAGSLTRTYGEPGGTNALRRNPQQTRARTAPPPHLVGLVADLVRHLGLVADEARVERPRGRGIVREVLHPEERVLRRAGRVDRLGRIAGGEAGQSQHRPLGVGDDRAAARGHVDGRHQRTASGLDDRLHRAVDVGHGEVGHPLRRPLVGLGDRHQPADAPALREARPRRARPSRRVSWNSQPRRPS